MFFTRRQRGCEECLQHSDTCTESFVLISATLQKHVQLQGVLPDYIGLLLAYQGNMSARPSLFSECAHHLDFKLTGM